MRAYHDQEWGRPVADDRRLFGKICPEGFQSGLSWRTILGKREAFRRAFAGFDLAMLAGWGEAEVRRLPADAGIVRHRGKVEAALDNARCSGMPGSATSTCRSRARGRADGAGPYLSDLAVHAAVRALGRRDPACRFVSRSAG
jgi:hypothetical protein